LNRAPTLCGLGLPVGAPPLRCLTFSLPPTPRRRSPGPVAARPHLSAVPHHVARAPPPSPVRQPTYDRAAQSHPDPAVCATNRRTRGPLSLPFSLLDAAPSRPPHFPLLFSPARPPIWRSHRRVTPLSSASTPKLEVPSFFTTYVPTSPAPATRDPSSSPVPHQETPPPPLHGVTLPFTTIVPN
jgi:hypothetical protein